ncbi:MAG: hypothetical protein JWQ30_1867 [Sediminibacterium sp.]|nr:hypothetical protein [Sediminibacterium sp.]
MKETLRLEEIAMAALGIYLLKFHSLGLPIWAWCLLFFAPDISMLGYLVNPKIGAVSYNLFHHKGIAITLTGIGYFLQIELLMATGILLLAHSSFDRVMGYGLKYQTSFNDTHIGKLKKDQ